MADRLADDSKAADVSAILNKVLNELVQRCTREDGVRDYFEVGVIGYDGSGPKNVLEGELSGTILNPIATIADHPLRIEDRVRKEPDGAGGIIELPVKFPVWVEPKANGGTPMRRALTLAAETLVPWCDSHPDSFPPIVMHLTDGESTDGDPEALADALREISTNDGGLILMNLHISGGSTNPITFPDSEDALSDPYAKLLFRMSSPLVGHMLEQARIYEYPVSGQSRGFMFRADYEHIVHFLNIGTPQAQALR